MYGHAFGLTGVSPNTRACFASTCGVVTYFIHMYAQFGCGARFASIQVSAQPVAPSVGIVSSTGAFAAFSCSVWYGQPAPITTSPFLKSEISSVAEFQYRFSSGFCFFSSETAASSCGFVSSYGSLIPCDACVFIRYRAASAIWIGLFGTVILPLYFGL